MENQSRSWEDMRQYQFMAAGGGPRWIDPLKRLKPGDEVYIYQGGRGYVGYGTVSSAAIPVKEFRVNGTAIGQLPLQQPGLCHDLDDLEMTEWIVPMRWHKTFSLSESKTFRGIFANPASVCKLRHSETIKFLQETFSTE